MHTSAQVAASPHKEAPRKSRSRAPRGTVNCVTHDLTATIPDRLRSQRLRAVFGLTELRARLIADLAFGGVS